MRKALERAGASVRVLSDQRSFAGRTPPLLRASLGEPTDAFLVGFPGHADVGLARLAGTARRAPIVFDAFVSLYESAVEDRQNVAPGSLAAIPLCPRRPAGVGAGHAGRARHRHPRPLLRRDGSACRPRKLRRVWVGADDDVMRPGGRPDDSQVPGVRLRELHPAARARARRRRGASARAARRRRVVHGGRRRRRRAACPPARRASSGVGNVDFVGWQPYETLPALMSAHHVCLGIFGTSPKVGRVIPNKLFDALAVARAVITADTPAVREVLTHGRDVWLCAAGSSEALAESIVALRDDRARRAMRSPAPGTSSSTRSSRSTRSRTMSPR